MTKVGKIPPGVGPKHSQVVVLVGATGDLSRRKLLPGLFYLSSAGFIPGCRIIGTSRRGRPATMAAMRLTPWEEERLLIFAAAELARRHRAAGLALNAPEAIALVCGRPSRKSATSERVAAPVNANVPRASCCDMTSK